MTTSLLKSRASNSPTRSDRGGKIGLRPVSGQRFPASLLIEGNKSLAEDYPVGTRFKIQAALMKRPSGAEYLFSSWQWDVKIIAMPDQAI